MHSTYGKGAWARYRRETRRRAAERARERPKCSQCGHGDSTGLIDGLCTRCFCWKMDAKPMEKP